jgi:hypothetical protein
MSERRECRLIRADRKTVGCAMRSWRHIPHCEATADDFPANRTLRNKLHRLVTNPVLTSPVCGAGPGTHS